MVRLIDWDEPGNNDFLLVLPVLGHRRDVQAPGRPRGLRQRHPAGVRRTEGGPQAARDRLRRQPDRLQGHHPATVLVQRASSSCPTAARAKVGSITAGWDHFADWKKIDSEAEAGRRLAGNDAPGTCEPARLLDIVENFTLFMEATGGLVKVVGQEPPVPGREQRHRGARRDPTDGRAGWGCSGTRRAAGKSISMIFFAQKVLRKLPGNWTFVVVTDRKELDDQIYKNFASTRRDHRGASAGRESSRHLRQLLERGSPLRLHPDPQVPHRGRRARIRCCRERTDIIVITDEAHRSQYDTLALNMRNALPNAAFLAFTGTPLIVGEEKTREVFGDYVSIYNFKQSVDDGATVPLYYENRIPELQLTNENFNEDMERAAGGGGAGRGPGEEAGAGVRPRVSPDHPRRPAGDGRRGHRRALHRAGATRARRWSSASTRPPPCGCTTRCRSTGRGRSRRRSPSWSWSIAAGDVVEGEPEDSERQHGQELERRLEYAGNRHGGRGLPVAERDLAS